MVDGLGRERRLPRGGPRGVTTAAVVRPGTPSAQLELRTADGTPRATLPWPVWFGADGADAVDEPGGLDGHGLDRHRLSGAVGRAAGLFGFAQQTVRQRHAPGGRGDDHDLDDGIVLLG